MKKIESRRGGHAKFVHIDPPLYLPVLHRNLRISIACLFVQVSILDLSIILSIWDHSHLLFFQKGMKSVISSCLLFSYVTLKDFWLRINGDGTCRVIPVF